MGADCDGGIGEDEMASEKNGLAETVGGVIGDVLGWAFCLAMTVGFYSLGYLVAPYFGMAEHRETAGLLAAISTIWMYEHRVAHERWAKLQS
jgi:hypothetical protein